MKNLKIGFLFVCLLLVGAEMHSQVSFSIIRNKSQLEVYEGTKLAYNINICDMSWYSTTNTTQAFNIEDNLRKVGLNLAYCTNYSSRVVLYAKFMEWKDSCNLQTPEPIDSSINYDSIIAYKVGLLNDTLNKTNQILLDTSYVKVVNDSINIYILNRDTATVRVVGLKDTNYSRILNDSIKVYFYQPILDVDTSYTNEFDRNNDTLSAILNAIKSKSDTVYNHNLDSIRVYGVVNIIDNDFDTVLIKNDSLNIHVLNQYNDSMQLLKIDSTNIILRQLTFESCGSSIPSNFVGFKFDNANDYTCAGTSPTQIEYADFQHCGQSIPNTPIPATAQSWVQKFINDTLIPDLNACYGLSLVSNDIIYLYNSSTDEVEVWYNPVILSASNPPHNFVVSQLGTNSPCVKPFPSISISNTSNGNSNALLVKVCEPLNVNTKADTTHTYILNEIFNRLDSNIIDRSHVSVTNFPTNASYNTNETYDVTTTITFPTNTIHSYTVIGVSGTFNITEQSLVSNIPSGVTISKTASEYFSNSITITTTGRVIVTIIK